MIRGGLLDLYVCVLCVFEWMCVCVCVLECVCVCVGLFVGLCVGTLRTWLRQRIMVSVTGNTCGAFSFSCANMPQGHSHLHRYSQLIPLLPPFIRLSRIAFPFLLAFHFAFFSSTFQNLPFL
jgi:hypothetical protein